MSDAVIKISKTSPKQTAKQHKLRFLIALLLIICIIDSNLLGFYPWLLANCNRLFEEF